MKPGELRSALGSGYLRLRRGWPPLPPTVWDFQRKRHKPMTELQRRRWARIYEVGQRYLRKNQKVNRIAKKMGLRPGLVSADLAFLVRQLVNHRWLHSAAQGPVELS